MSRLIEQQDFRAAIKDGSYGVICSASSPKEHARLRWNFGLRQ
jgi:hypothetical protein